MVMTPCLAMWENFQLGSELGVVQPSGKKAGHRSLLWRWEQLTSCRTLNVEMMHRGHFVKQAVTHYFARAETGLWAGRPNNWFTRLPKGWPSDKAWIGTGLKVCFYLGKFPVYWDPKRFAMIFADGMVAGTSYAVGLRPFILGVDMDLFEGLDPDRRDIYFSSDVIRAYARQREFLDYWAGWQMRCRQEKYDPEEKKERYVKGTKMPWPGVPMSQVKPPTPQAPPAEIPPGHLKLFLELGMTQTYSPDPDALNLDLLFTKYYPP